MQKIILVLSFFIYALFANPLFGNIDWSNNYQDSLKKAREKQKPLLLYLSKPDPLCWRLEKQILETKDFFEQTNGHFIFVRIELDQNERAIYASEVESEILKKKFKIESFPSLLIISPEGKRLAERSYIPVDAKKYAEHLLEISHDYAELKKGLQTLEKIDAPTLKKLYIKAKTFQQKEEMLRLIELGKSKGPQERLFFLSEQLSFLADEGSMQTAKAKQLRKELLQIDENNEHGKHRFVALLEFQGLSKDPSTHPLKAIEPLLHYLKRFEDPKNNWRIQMTISQYLFSQNKISEAIEFANDSYQKAPTKRKASIKMAIEHMTAQLQSPLN